MVHLFYDVFLRSSNTVQDALAWVEVKQKELVWMKSTFSTYKKHLNTS